MQDLHEVFGPSDISHFKQTKTIKKEGGDQKMGWSIWDSLLIRKSMTLCIIVNENNLNKLNAINTRDRSDRSRYERR